MTGAKIAQKTNMPTNKLPIKPNLLRENLRIARRAGDKGLPTDTGRGVTPIELVFVILF
jgi:hypothetical protein